MGGVWRMGTNHHRRQLLERRHAHLHCLSRSRILFLLFQLHRELAISFHRGCTRFRTGCLYLWSCPCISLNIFLFWLDPQLRTRLLVLGNCHNFRLLFPCLCLFSFSPFLFSFGALVFSLSFCSFAFAIAIGDFVVLGVGTVSAAFGGLVAFAYA